MCLINVCYPRDYESWSSKAPQARAGKPLHHPLSQQRDPRSSAHPRALSAARETKPQDNLKQPGQDDMHLKSIPPPLRSAGKFHPSLYWRKA